MNAEQKNIFKKWFHNYVEDIPFKDEKITTFIQLKLEHSLKVADTCKTFAEKMDWSQADTYTAEVIGLFHDIGRFSQLVEFRTFADNDSINHGERGFRLIKQLRILSTLHEKDRSGILNGIRYHNSRKIPPHINSDCLLFLRLVRDADKLDIIRVIRNHIKNNRIEEHPEVILNIDINGPVNPDALAQILDGEPISYKNVKSLADFGLAQLAWIYDVNYKVTFQEILDRNMIEKITEFFPHIKEIQKAKQQIKSYIRDKI